MKLALDLLAQIKLGVTVTHLIFVSFYPTSFSCLLKTGCYYICLAVGGGGQLLCVFISNFVTFSSEVAFQHCAVFEQNAIHLEGI